MQESGLDTAPAPLWVARHFGNHGVGLELEIEIAARDMAEGRRDHVGALIRGRFCVAGSQPRVSRRFPSIQSSVAHRLVMGMHHTAVATGMALGRQQGRQRHRLRRRKGDVKHRTV